jgi:hypothetical protein
MGLTGLEPVTLRLSSACSNQLSYRPKVRFQQVRRHSSSKESGEKLVGQAQRLARALARQMDDPESRTQGTNFGGKGIRTPDL